MNETDLAVKKYLDGGIPKIVEQLEMDEYESTGGFLRNNAAFRALKEMSNPKRHPDSNGVLPLTPEELYDIKKIVKNNGLILGVVVRDDMLELKRPSGSYEPIKDFKTIYRLTIYLDKLFELGGK